MGYDPRLPPPEFIWSFIFTSGGWLAFCALVWFVITAYQARTTHNNACQHGQSAPLAVPQLGSCASSGRAWRLWAAQHSQEEGPLGA